MNDRVTVPGRRSDRPCVSVAMATFNGERYVRAQLESLAGQTRLPDEVIVFDDGSTDRTATICAEFAQGAPFAMTVDVNPRRLGYAHNFERALMATAGEYVFLCDQDDVWYPRKVETMLSVVSADPTTQVAIHDLRVCGPDMTSTSQTKLQRVRWVGGAERSYVTGMATTVRRALLECAMPLPEDAPVTHDAWLHACGEALGGRVVVPQVLADYRRHGANATEGLGVNAPGSVSAARLSYDALVAPNRSQVAARERLYSEVARWLSERRECIEAKGITNREAIDRAAADWRTRADRARQRLEVVSKPRLYRVVPAFRLWFEDGYSPFSGWRSLVKDLFSR